MFLIRGRNKQRQSVVAPCPPTATPSTSASASFSIRASTSHSTSHSLPTARRPSIALPTLTDGWVCDPAISALHFAYALTAQAAAEEEEDDGDRNELQSPRPIPSSSGSPVSFLSLDGGSIATSPLSPKPAATLTAATMPTTYRRVSLADPNNHTDTRRNNQQRAPKLSLSPTSVSASAIVDHDTSSPTSPANRGGRGGKKHDWLQSTLRLAFGRRTAEKDCAEEEEAEEPASTVMIEVAAKIGSGSSRASMIAQSDKSAQSTGLQIPRLQLPLPQR